MERCWPASRWVSLALAQFCATKLHRGEWPAPVGGLLSAALQWVAEWPMVPQTGLCIGG